MPWKTIKVTRDEFIKAAEDGYKTLRYASEQYWGTRGGNGLSVKDVLIDKVKPCRACYIGAAAYMLRVPPSDLANALWQNSIATNVMETSDAAGSKRKAMAWCRKFITDYWPADKVITVNVR